MERTGRRAFVAFLIAPDRRVVAAHGKRHNDQSQALDAIARDARLRRSCTPGPEAYDHRAGRRPTYDHTQTQRSDHSEKASWTGWGPQPRTGHS